MCWKREKDVERKREKYEREMSEPTNNHVCTHMRQHVRTDTAHAHGTHVAILYMGRNEFFRLLRVCMGFGI